MSCIFKLKSLEMIRLSCLCYIFAHYKALFFTDFNYYFGKYSNKPFLNNVNKTLKCCFSHVMKLGHNNHILHVHLIDFPKASTNKKGRVSNTKDV